jgi:5-methyltetrahydrofolate--homocysteine methyltransferase
MALRVRQAIEAHQRGDLILPQLLEVAESTPPDAQSRGSVIVASLVGDVHAIGRALLLTILSRCGYSVHDLGKNVAIQDVVDAAERLRPDAIALTALLVTTSRQMPACVRALDQRGLDIPVLLGGAAINRTFGRRSGILPDGRVYAAGVFYCRDVFEGVEVLDTLTDPLRRNAFIQQTNAEIVAERDRIPDVMPPVATARHSLPRMQVPTPHQLGLRDFAPELGQVWLYLDTNTLFRFHWGGYRSKPSFNFDAVLAALWDDAQRNVWLQPRVVSGVFRCRSEGDGLLIDDRVRLEFPRQSGEEGLCLADYFHDDGDVVALQAVTAGARAGQYVEELQQDGQYARMLYVNGLASATAEALADFAHDLARTELGIAQNQGLRFSWGYAACPDLAEQRKALSLLEAEARIELRLSESDTLNPEHSTAALIVHHPDATYFAVR